jgi:hypothetical protein
LMDTASVESTLLTKPLMIVDRSEYHTGGTWFKPTTFAGLLAVLGQELAKLWLEIRKSALKQGSNTRSTLA